MTEESPRMPPAIDRGRERATAWWAERSQRERVLLSMLAVLVLGWSIMTMIVQPLLHARRTAIAEIRLYESLTTRLRLSGPLGAAPVAQRPGSPATVLSTSAAEYGLSPVVTPDQDGFRVTMADAPYEALMRWISDVERTSALRFTGLQVARRPAEGIVAAEMQVRG